MKKLKLEELKRPTVEEYRQVEKNPIVVVLDNIRSALNIGSVFRSADAFAIQKIVLCGISTTPPNREITKTAIGATESVNWTFSETTEKAVLALKAEGYCIIGVEQTDESIMLDDFQPNFERVVLVFGNEVSGISEDVLKHLDYCVEIPQYGTKHSLNISVCAGIVLWEMTKKLSQ